MDFTPEPEQQAVADVVTSVMDRENTWEALISGGVLALGLPERLGGDGVGLAELTTALTEIGRRGLVSPALATIGFGLIPLLDAASAAQQDRLLGGVGSGAVLTGAFNEPGSALPELPSASFADGLLNGTKVAVPYAEQAQWIVVTTSSAVVVVSSTADGVQLAKSPSSAGGEEYSVTFVDVAVDPDLVLDTTVHRVNQLVLAAVGAFGAGLVAGALRLTADYVASREQFGRPLSTFQTVAAQLAEIYIASRTLDLAATSVIWRLCDGRDADEDLDVLGYWLASQAPPAMQLCHHLHGGMGMDITYPMHRYYSLVKDLSRFLAGPSYRLELVGAQCSSN